MTRAKGTMPMPLYRKIVDEAATIPVIEKLTLTGLGETLLDRFLVERVFYARSVFPPGVTIDLYTNGTFLRPKLTDALIAAGLNVIYVSLNATNREKRREIMQVDDFDDVVSYTKYALDATKGTRCRVIVKGIASKDLMEVGEHEQFQEMWGGDWDKGGNSYIHLEGSWAGSSRTLQMLRTKPRNACHRALGQIMVLWDGRVSLCCFDGNGDVILGDLNYQTLREVYESPTYVGIRLAHAEGRRQEIPICANCTSI
jgi:hypothetical protein